MLVAIGDTHETDGHALEGAALDAVRTADLVVHTGDFTRAPVLEAFEAEATTLAAVQGNNDDEHIRERLPAVRLVEGLDRRFAVTHGHQRDSTALSLLARQEAADAVIVGHSHKPGIRDAGGVPVINPGSHADPRWHRPAFAVLERDPDAQREADVGVRVSLRSPDGETFETKTL